MAAVRIHFMLVALIAMAFVWTCYLLSGYAAMEVRGTLTRTETMHQFVSVSSPSMMPANAASGLALLASPVSNTVIVAVANFYGGSIIYRLDTAGTTLSSTNVMELNTRAAHDFEAVDLRPNGPVMLVGAEYDGDATLVYTFVEDPNAKQATLAGWPKCDDSDGLACASWAKAGECVHNPSFMHQSCPKACGRCKALHGPVRAVQALESAGGTSARHIHVSGRDLLVVANYKAPEGQAIGIYEWRREASEWAWSTHIAVAGAGEFAHCHVAETGEDLLVISTWFANNSFSASSWVYHIKATPDPAGGLSFEPRQALPTEGSHDAECFTSRAGQTILVLANGRRDDGTRDVASAVYTYNAQEGRFVETQRLPTVAAHDVELIEMGTSRLAVVSNGASWRDGKEVCDNRVSIFRWDETRRRFAPFQELDAGGCTTFSRAWHVRSGNGSSEGRTLLAVAVERLANGSFSGGVAFFEWRTELRTVVSRSGAGDELMGRDYLRAEIIV